MHQELSMQSSEGKSKDMTYIQMQCICFLGQLKQGKHTKLGYIICYILTISTPHLLPKYNINLCMTAQSIILKLHYWQLVHALAGQKWFNNKTEIVIFNSSANF